MPSELREALTAAGVSPLIAKVIDPMLLEYQRRYSPLTRAIPSVKWNSDIYYYNQRTVNPNGGFITDGGARPLSNSTYVQNSFQMKHFQSVGAITGYAQEVTREVIGDLRAREIQGTIQGLYWDIEHALIWGNAAATASGPYPQFDGLASQLGKYSGDGQNSIDVTGDTGGGGSAGSLNLGYLDQLADLVESNVAMSVFDSSWMFVMSNTAVSRIAQLLVNQQRFVDQVEVAAGLNVPTYRGIPLIKSSFLSNRGYTVGTVSTSTGTTTVTGTIATGTTYYYQVSAVIGRQSEIVASAEVSQATSANSSWIKLSFTPPTGLDGVGPVLYKVYRGSSTGAETLLGVVDATVGLNADGITPIQTTAIYDTGATLIAANGSTLQAQYPASYAGGNSAQKPPAAGTESIYLMSRDENFICRPYVRELTPLDIYPTTSSPDSLPYALIADCVLAVRAPKYIGALTGVNVSLTDTTQKAV